MIWYIIVGTILLGMIALLLSAVWEVDVTTHFTYDKNGTEKKDAEDIDEYRSNPSVILEALKEIYPENYAKAEKWATEHERNVDSYVLGELRYNRLPCRGYIKKKIQVDDYWYEAYRSVTAYIIGGVCLIALGVMGGTNAAAKLPWAVEFKTVEYEEEITALENNKQYITTYYTSGVGKDIDISSTNIPAVIKEHNEQVKNLIKQIKVDRVNLKNPWVSPWVNPACNNVDLLRVEATYINNIGA